MVGRGQDPDKVRLLATVRELMYNPCVVPIVSALSDVPT